MRGLFISVQNFFHTVSWRCEELISKHWSNGIGGSMSGVYILVPFTRLSMWIECREVSVGFALERGDEGLEVFAGRFQAVFCIEPKRA